MAACFLNVASKYSPATQHLGEFCQPPADSQYHLRHVWQCSPIASGNALASAGSRMKGEYCIAGGDDDVRLYISMRIQAIESPTAVIWASFAHADGDPVKQIAIIICHARIKQCSASRPLSADIASSARRQQPNKSSNEAASCHIAGVMIASYFFSVHLTATAS